MVIIVGLLWPVLERQSDSDYWVSAVGALTYTANLLVSFGGLKLGVLDPTWSLALEEQFYVVWPLALMGILALNLRRRTTVMLLLLIGLASFVLGALLFEPALRRAHTSSRITDQTPALVRSCLVALPRLFASERGRAILERYSWVGWLGLAGILALVIGMPHDWTRQHGVFGLLLPLAAVFSTLLITGSRCARAATHSAADACVGLVWED